jgi:hypothetical protein
MNSSPKNRLICTLFRLLLQLRSPAGRHSIVSAETVQRITDSRIHTEAPPLPALGVGTPHRLYHIAQSHLDNIVRQVHADGYHVERISNFGIEHVTTAALVELINEWASSVELKAGFNHEHNICVFEEARLCP